MKIIHLTCKHCQKEYSSTEILEKYPSEEDEFCPHCLGLVRKAGTVNPMNETA